MRENTAVLLERLRGQIRKLEAQPRALVMALSSGEEELDALGVFRLGAGVELCGEEASGRTTLALSVVAAACREKRLAAWVDGPQELYPPAAVSLGVELERLLIIRPKAPAQLVWSAVQLLRSGAFACVVLDVTHTGVLPSLTDTKKLLDAARAGGSLLVLLTSQRTPAQGLVRLMLRQRREEPRQAVGRLRCVGGGQGVAPGGLPAVDDSESDFGAGAPVPLRGPVLVAVPAGAPGSTSHPPVRDGVGVDSGGASATCAEVPSGVDAGVDPDVDDLSFLVETPRGGRVPLRRARLVREVVPVRRAGVVGSPPGPVRVASEVSWARPRKNLLRDGYGLGASWRPGREGPLDLPAPLRTVRSWR